MTDVSPELLAQRKRAAAAPRRAVLADAPVVSRTLARSFATDPVVDWFVRDDARREKALDQWFDFAVKKLGLPGREVWMSDDSSAVALWIPPPQDTMQLSIVDEVAAIPMFLSVVSFQRLGRMQRLRAAFDANHPKAPHWYLFFLAVDPDCQGQGLGSAILKSTLDAIDAKHEAAYLEASSEKNVPLYLRHGFEIVSEFRPEPTGPKLWGMWRKPR
ncbi:MAG: GNAT family N-acetyltransferase [Hyphomonadaceae bacterium]|nr:GNAT family N-acetyltransferase [Hyphomonadaceae bacterium]